MNLDNIKENEIKTDNQHSQRDVKHASYNY